MNVNPSQVLASSLEHLYLVTLSSGQEMVEDRDCIQFLPQPRLTSFHHGYVQCGIAGFGLIQAPGIAVESFLASGELVEVLMPYRPKPRVVSVMYPSRTHLAPEINAFVEWLKAHVPALHPDWFKAH